MKIFTKATTLLFIIFFIKLVNSCEPKTGEIVKIYYDIDSITVLNMDNAGEYLTYNKVDKMQSEAVAFQLKLLSKQFSKQEYYASKRKSFSFEFTPMSAKSPAEPEIIPNQTIRKISIITLEDLSAEISAGTNVTDNFLVSISLYDLYVPIDEYLKVPTKPAYDRYERQIDMVL